MTNTDIALIAAIASVCHEANRQYGVTLGDTPQSPWAEWQRESAIKGVIDLYLETNEARTSIKSVAEHVNRIRREAGLAAGAKIVDGEVPANATIAYRELEHASMRLGKVLQALEGGVSVYDKATTVGA